MKYVSYFISIILFIVVAIVGINIVRSQINTIKRQNTSGEQLDFSEYTKNGVKLRFIVKGPVVADESHQELVFEVGQGTRVVKFINGYNGVSVKDMSLGNNLNAYQSFARALYSAGFSKAREGQKEAKYLEQCPDGNLYTAEIINSSGVVKSSLWSASCNSKIGSLSASSSTILGLFQDQFPEYPNFSSDIEIN